MSNGVNPAFADIAVVPGRYTGLSKSDFRSSVV